MNTFILRLSKPHRFGLALGLCCLLLSGLAFADLGADKSPGKYLPNPALIQKLKQVMPCYNKGDCVSVTEPIADTPLELAKALELMTAAYGKPPVVRKEPGCIATYFIKDNDAYFSVEIALTVSDKTYARYSAYNNTEAVNKALRLERNNATNKHMRKRILEPIEK
jgi:hypothetical protein